MAWFQIRCLCILLLCLLVLTDAKFGRHKKADRNGRVHFHGRQSHGSRSLDLNYNATLKVNPDDVINLDDIRPASVECYSNSVVIVFTAGSVSNSFRDVNETKSPLNWSAGDIITGGSEYGCTIDNAPHDLMRRITRLSRFNSRYVLQTVTVNLQDVFSELNGTLEVIRTDVTRQEPVFPTHSRDKSVPQEVLILSSNATNVRRKRATTADSIQLFSPQARQNFVNPDQLIVNFVPDFTGTVSFKVYEDVFLTDPTIISSGALSVVAGQQVNLVYSTAGIKSSPDYYIEFYKGGSTILTMRYFAINYRENGYFSSPAPASEFYLGSYLNVSFVIDASVTSVTVEVYRNVENGFDDKRFSGSYSIVPSQLKNIQVPINSTWIESNNYYVYLTWDCSLGLCESATSEYFTVRRNHTNAAITFQSPKSSSVYSNGQNITLTWYAENPISDAIVYLKQDRPGLDPIQLTLTLAPFPNGTRFIRVPVNANWPPFSQYYFEIRYNCVPSGELCDIAQTNRFSIAFTPMVQFISPPANKRYTVGDVMRLDWNTTKPSAYVTLVADYPIYIPFVSPLWEGNLNLQQDINITISGGMASSFPVHFEVAYDCAYADYYCTVERGPQFFITNTYSGGFNYDALTGRANNSINILTKNCTSLGYEQNATCPSDTFMTPVCEFCSFGGELEITLDCDNCWVTTEVTLAVITFTLSSVNLELYSDFDLNVDLLLNVTGKYSYESEEIKLNPEPIPVFAFVLDLYVFTAKIGLVSNVYFKYQYLVEATGIVTMGFDVSVPLHLQIDTSNTSEFKPDLVFNRHGPNITVVGGVTGRADLIIELQLSALSMLEFTGRLIPYATLNGTFQIPPYDALQLPGYVNPDSEFHLGDCTVKHAFEYDIDVGLDVYFAIDAFGYHVWDKTYAAITPIPFVSGCLIQILRFENVCFEFSKTPAQLRFSPDLFVSLFVRDLISGVDSRFSTDQFFTLSVDVDISTTAVCLLVIEDSGLTLEQIINEITNEISNDNSRLFDTTVSVVSPYLIRPATPVPVIAPIADAPIQAPVTVATPVDPPIEAPMVNTPVQDTPVQGPPVSYETPTTVVPPLADTPIDAPINTPYNGAPIASPVSEQQPPVTVPSIEPMANPQSNAPAQDQNSPVYVDSPVTVPPVDSPSGETPTTVPVQSQEPPVSNETPNSVPLNAPIESPISSQDPPVTYNAPIEAPISSPTVDTPISAPVQEQDPPVSIASPISAPISNSPVDTPRAANVPIGQVPVSSPLDAPLNSPLFVPVGSQPLSVPISSPCPRPTPNGDNVPMAQIPPITTAVPVSTPKAEDAQGQISGGTSLLSGCIAVDRASRCWFILILMQNLFIFAAVKLFNRQRNINTRIINNWIQSN